MGECLCQVDNGANVAFKEFYNGTKAGPACEAMPLCSYDGAAGSCISSTDGTCTDVKVSCIGGQLKYWRFYNTRDGSCKGPSLGPFGGSADGACHNSNDGSRDDHKYWFIQGTCKNTADAIAAVQI